MSPALPPRAGLLRWTIMMLVGIEFLQNAMLSFSAAYVSGGVGAAPEEFSLAAAVYAGTAIVMIAMHRWLVEQLGYRPFIRCALLVFTVGAVLCAMADTTGEFIFGRFVQAIGGSAFFTGARVQVNRFRGPARGVAIRFMAGGLIASASLGAWLASMLLEHATWRALFLGPLPMVAIAAVLCELTLEDRVPHARRSHPHPIGTMLLAGMVLCAQYLLERSQYDFFARPLHLAVLLVLAGLGLYGFMRMEFGRPGALLPLERFTGGRFAAGISLYALCYLVLSSTGYMLPVTLQRGLGFPVLATGALLTAAALVGIVAALAHVSLVRRFPSQRKYLLLAFGSLTAFGFTMSAASPDVPLWHFVLPLIAYAVFGSFAQGTAALNSFADIGEDVFSEAYQAKNMMRELVNSTGISIATLILQSRSTLHYSRIVERIDVAHLDPVSAGPFAGLIANPTQPALLQQLASTVTQQATLMACLDFFFALGCGAVVIGAVFMLQRKIV
jgi:MFS family permease